MAAPPEVEEPSEPLKYKTWVLKVSIHCEGCKKKVKRILHGIEGVYTIDVDTKSHKVTVTGNVDSESLIRKLEKSGKHAELWPEKPDQKEKKSSKSKKKEKQIEPEATQEEDEEDKPDNDSENTDEREKPEGGAPIPRNEAVVSPKVVEILNLNPGSKTVGNVQVVKEVRVEQKKPLEGAPVSGENIPVTERKLPESEPAGASGEKRSGSGGKKKKKKGHKVNTGNGDEGEVTGEANGPAAAPPISEFQNHGNGPVPGPGLAPGPGPYPVNLSPPRHHPMYDYPTRYYAPPPPVYAVNYNTAYPASTHTASYYAAPSPYSYAYLHHGAEMDQPAPSDWGSPSLQPSDTFEMFSDENPNACSVM